jgi:hypothetical protein
MDNEVVPDFKDFKKCILYHFFPPEVKPFLSSAEMINNQRKKTVVSLFMYIFVRRSGRGLILSHLVQLTLSCWLW